MGGSSAGVDTLHHQFPVHNGFLEIVGTDQLLWIGKWSHLSSSPEYDLDSVLAVRFPVSFWNTRYTISRSKLNFSKRQCI